MHREPGVVASRLCGGLHERARARLLAVPHRAALPTAWKQGSRACCRTPSITVGTEGRGGDAAPGLAGWLPQAAAWSWA